MIIIFPPNMTEHYASFWYPHFIPVDWDRDSVTVLDFGGVRTTNMVFCRCDMQRNHTKSNYIIHASSKYRWWMNLCACMYNYTTAIFPRKEWEDIVKNYYTQCSCCSTENLMDDGLIPVEKIKKD